MKKNLKLEHNLQVIFLFLGCIIFFGGCTSKSEKSTDTLFERISPSESNIGFSNDVIPDQNHNISKDNNFYSGGGVALGDINKDGLTDIYLVANQKSNRLYLNKGNFEFKDITESAKVGGTKPWSTGVSMIDINGDSLLDIYVSNSGLYNGKDRENELFINNGDLTFTERAEDFGLADSGYSMHATFFDYDNDGDLDMYLVNNHNSKPIGVYDLKSVSRKDKNFESGDRLFRNDNGEFTDVTQQAGIYSNGISFSYGATVGDLNRDGWMDIYISNDFFERDYLYMNQGDGRFKEVLTEKLSSTSTTSMSGDIADLNNDGFPEIFITDMLPETEERIKTITDFIGWKQYQSEVKMGFHRKFTRNTLHYNNTNGRFSEIGRYAGVEATDWSWGALMADFNLDGLRDIFVANGIYKDVTEKDHLLAVAQGKIRNEIVKNGKVDFVKLDKIMSTTPISNYMFENKGEVQFTNKATKWGLDKPGFSNGSAYGDLDRDGDLDLVINNVNMHAFIYENNITERHPERSWMQIKLEGQSPNTFGIGAQVELVAGEHFWYAKQMLQRGFHSSVDLILNVGLGKDMSLIDTVRVHWPNGDISLKKDVKTGQRLVIKQSEAKNNSTRLNVTFRNIEHANKPMLTDITDQIALDWQHEESSYNDFKRSPLLFHMRSTEGPPICKGDVNGDGLDDFFVGGARGQSGALFIQENEGLIKSYQPALENDQEAEDTGCVFFDADRDSLLELYVASGSSEFPARDRFLADRLYQIGKEDKLKRSGVALPRPKGGPKPTGVVEGADFNGDGYVDLFSGTRSMVPYGTPVGGRLLINDGSGRFEDATDRLAPQVQPDKLKSAGITDAAWGDLNGDSTPDLIIVGEWMPLTVFYNRNGRLERVDQQDIGLKNTRGWWQSIELSDLNGDGRLDLIAGNSGLNSRFKASREHPFQMWAGDVDDNGTIEQVFARYKNGRGPYPVALRQNLLKEIPGLRGRYPSFSKYAGQNITDIFTQKQLDEAIHYKVNELSSVVGWNTGKGGFCLEPLPTKAQWAPIYAILPEDLDGNGTPEILLAGNLDAVQPQAGPYDATYGIVLRQDSTGNYKEVPSTVSGFLSQGNIRDLQTIQYRDQHVILVTRNDNSLKIFQNNYSE